MPMPGAKSQALSASLGGGLHVDKRNFAGPQSNLGPVAGKVASLPGAQSQAMTGSRGGGLHFDARKLAAPRFKFTSPQSVIVEKDPAENLDLTKWERIVSTASTDVPSEHGSEVPLVAPVMRYCAGAERAVIL